MIRQFKPVRFFVLMGVAAFIVCGVAVFYTHRTAHGTTAEENPIRRRICVVSRIRDAEYGLVAHGHLAAKHFAADTAATTSA